MFFNRLFSFLFYLFLFRVHVEHYANDNSLKERLIRFFLTNHKTSKLITTNISPSFPFMFLHTSHNLYRECCFPITRFTRSYTHMKSKSISTLHSKWTKVWMVRIPQSAFSLFVKSRSYLEEFKPLYIRMSVSHLTGFFIMHAWKSFTTLLSNSYFTNRLKHAKT